ncbi:MAG: glycosyltransferase family 39 protein [Bacteroidota bacterium]
MDLNISIKNNNLLISIMATVIVAFFLRFYKLGDYPLQINQDELSNIYDGYCISETGADRWGVKTPIILKAFGEFDNRPPLYAYLAAISIKIFGYSIISGRLPSAIIGFISLFLLYYVANKLGGRLYGFICLLLAAISPWHLIYSRIAHEGAALPPFFIIFTLFLWFRCREKNFSLKYLLSIGFVMGLATNAYQATKMIFLLVSFLVAIDVAIQTKWDIKKLIYLSIAIFLGASPQILASILYPDQFFSRANDQMIDFSFSLSCVKTIATNFLHNFSPQYLFLSFGEFNNLTIGRLMLFEIGFFYSGLFLFYHLHKHYTKFDIKYIYLLLIVSVIPATITKDNPHALRASASILLLPIFSGAAIHFCYQKLTKLKFGNSISLFITGLFILNIVFNISQYTKSPEMRGQGHQYGQVAMYTGMKDFHHEYDTIYIQLYGAFQYLFVASYLNMHPKEYQNQEKIHTKTGWYDFSKLGKFQFLSIDQIKAKNSSPQKGKNLLVLLEKSEKYTLVDSVYFMGEKIYYYKN